MGKRLLIFCQLLFLGTLISGEVRAQSAPHQEPVFVYLNGRFTDYINIEMTEDRLRRLLPEIEKYRKEHPSEHVSTVVFFSGASSEALAQRNTQTHIVDFVKGYLRRGVIEAGYDGEDEPTYENRPMVDFKDAKSVDDRWLVRGRCYHGNRSDGKHDSRSEDGPRVRPPQSSNREDHPADAGAGIRWRFGDRRGYSTVQHQRDHVWTCRR